MNYRVEFSQARDEANAAHRWIADNLSLTRAERWYRSLFRHAETLTRYPLRCPLAPETDEFPTEIRELIYGRRRNRYRIIFEIRGDVVFILHIRHAAQDEIRP